MKPWKGIRRFTISGLGQPKSLAVGGKEPTHFVLPVQLDRGTSLLLITRVGASELAKRLLEVLANDSLPVAEATEVEVAVTPIKGEVAGDEVAMLESIQVPEEETRGDTG